MRGRSLLLDMIAILAIFGAGYGVLSYLMGHDRTVVSFVEMATR